MRESHDRPAQTSRAQLRWCVAVLIAGLACVLISAGSLPAATLQVGSGKTYASLTNLPSLSPGDIVEIYPGTYNALKMWYDSGTAASPITIRGIGTPRPVMDGTGLYPDGSGSTPRAMYQFQNASHFIVENIEFMNATNGDNGAGIRVVFGDDITIRNCKITYCDMGIMCNGNDNLLIEHSEIAFNGTPLYDGYSHNFYLGGQKVTIQYCYIHDSLYGQNFKTRGHYTELLYNYIADSQDGEIGFADEADTTPLPNSHAVMIGNVIISKPRQSGYNSGRFINFGQDSGNAHNGTLYAYNNTFIAGDGRIQFLVASTTGATIVAKNNIFYGSGQIVGPVGGGISGANNWMPSTATVPGTFTSTTQGTNPGFADVTNRDFHLTAGSACRDKAVGGLTYLDGTGASHSGTPVWEYVNHVQNVARFNDGQMDLGAYEYNAGGAQAPVINSIRPVGSNPEFTWASIVGTTYAVYKSTNLFEAWLTQSLTNIVGDGSTKVFIDPAAVAPFACYRVTARLP
jgi:hypothetical protein